MGAVLTLLGGVPARLGRLDSFWGARASLRLGSLFWVISGCPVQMGLTPGPPPRYLFGGAGVTSSVSQDCSGTEMMESAIMAAPSLLLQ